MMLGLPSAEGSLAALWSSLTAHCVWLGGGRPGEWIMGRGENEGWGAGADLGLDMGRMGAQRIINLLFVGRNSLVINFDSLHYLAHFAGLGRWDDLEALIDEGGRGSAASDGRCLFNTLGLAKFLHIARGLKIRLKKKGGPRAGLHNTART